MYRLRYLLPQQWLVLTVGLVGWLAMTVAAADDWTPMFKPNLQIAKSAGAINIDGKLGDSGWRNAAHVDRFHERTPGDNTKPEVQTDVYITYDDDKLYVAFDCKDDPASIRATMSQRDQYSGDDMVSVLLDSYGTGVWAYEFFVNPYGIQRDLLWNSLGRADVGFDCIWESASQRTADGYTVEMAIPFASIRFPNQPQQAWRMDFWRNRPRDITKQYSWAANDRNEQCFPCQWGTVTGINDVHPGKGLGILPSMVSHQNGELVDNGSPEPAFHNGDPTAELSLGAKYALSSDITAEGTVNPDFSQIESDAAQIDANSTISLYYPERRPFFQEGSDIFFTLFNSFYTRMVWDPKMAAKLTGRHGQTRLGFLAAYDENSPYIVPLDAADYEVNTGKSAVSVFRVAQQFGAGNFLGAMVGDRRYNGGGSGTIVSLDGAWRLNRTYNVAGQYVMTHTTEPKRPDLDTLVDSRYYIDKYIYELPDSLVGISRFDQGKHTNFLDGESYYGDAFITRFNRGTRHWYSFLGYNQIAPTYRTQIGYDPVANHRTFEAFTGVSILPKNGPIQNINPQVYYSRRWDFKTGVCRYDQLNTAIDVQTNVAQTHIGLNYQNNYERWAGVPFDDLYSFGLNLDTRVNDQIGGGIYANRGKGIARRYVAKGNTTGYGFYLSLKPVDRVTVEPTLDYQRMTRPADGRRYYAGFITRTRVQYQATKALSFRLVVQHNNFYRVWDVDPLLTYRLSPFSVFYLGSSIDYGEVGPTLSNPDNPLRWRNTSRQFFMKIQYLFQT
ncbi:hypothetical protein C3F09_12940 [candidate division GN15 bacterium]|uniref:Carbohydrate-binding domain-containing protein n=1 Tax=candidate division GN15 bacterium TaxID=2072418 RepID=A0A855X2X7_9BACT|nr:MAG: hypothetical protein C3F09_12940 [candidate division GN15 bacterium]